MRGFCVDDEDLAVIREQRFAHPHPRVQQKLEVLWLKAKSLPHAQIEHITGLARCTIQRYLREFRQGGLPAILECRLKQAKPPSQLSNHVELLRQHFAQHPPRCVREAQAEIERLTGIRRGLTQTRLFLKKNLV